MVKNANLYLEKLLGECEVMYNSDRKRKIKSQYKLLIQSIVAGMNRYTGYKWDKLSDIFKYDNLCTDLYYSFRLAEFVYSNNTNIQINSISEDIINKLDSSDIENAKESLKASIQEFKNDFPSKVLSLDKDNIRFEYEYSKEEIEIMKEKNDSLSEVIDEDGLLIKTNNKLNQNSSNSQKVIPLIGMNNYNNQYTQKETKVEQSVQEQNKSSLIAKDTDDFTNTAKTVINYLDKFTEKKSIINNFLGLLGIASLKDKNIISIVKGNDFITDIISDFFGNDIIKSINILDSALKHGFLKEIVEDKIKNKVDDNTNKIVDSFIKLIYSLNSKEYNTTFVLLLLEMKNEYLSKNNIINDNDIINVDGVKTEQSVQQPQEPKVEQQVQQPQWTNPITPEEEEMVKKAKVVKQQDQQKQQPVQQEQKEPESYSLMDAINSTTLGRKLFQKIDNVAV